MNRIKTIIVVLLAMAGQAQAATYYKIKVAGYEVNSSNASSITGDRIKAYKEDVNGGKPSVTYTGNATSGTLTLYNVKIERDGNNNRAILNDGNPGLTIVFKGENYLYAEDASPVRLNANTTITCRDGGKATIEGLDQDALCPYDGATVTINDADLIVWASNSSGIEGGSSGSSGGSIVINNSKVESYGSKASIRNMKSVTVKGNSDVKLTMRTTNVTVQNVAAFNIEVPMAITNPKNGYFSSSKKTICSSDEPDGRRTTIHISKVALDIDALNFPDSRFRSWVKSNCDKNGDNYLTSAELNDVKEINVSSYSIGSLNGIELFPNLKTLYCMNNTIRNLDVSKNTALIALLCDQNLLGSLDVSKNTALLSLSCSENGLNSLDVSKNTALVSLICSENGLNSLDVSKNTALVSLNCSENGLSSLDVSKNKALKQLQCYDNHIATLTLSSSNNTVLTDIRADLNRLRDSGMETLVNSLPTVTSGKLCIVNQNESATSGNLIFMSQVNKAKSKGWKVDIYMEDFGTTVDFPGVPPGPAINETNFPDATFRSYVRSNIDIDKDDYLSDIEIDNIKLLDLKNKGISNLKGIEFLTSLMTLDCNGNNLKTLDLSKNTNLTGLWCQNNQLKSLDLSKNTALVHLYCSYNGLESLNLSNCTELKNFYGGGNAMKILDLSPCTKIEIVSCIDNGLTVLTLPASTKLSNLNCSNNRIGTLDVTDLTNLTELSCSGNELKKLDVSHNKMLKSLKCNDNLISDLEMSTQCTALTLIHCQNNCLTEPPMWKLVMSLPTVTWGLLCVVSDSESPTTGNFIITKFVNIAKDKGWEVTMLNAAGEYVPYAGIDPGIAVNYTNFPDSNFNLYVKSEFDTDDNGYLSDAEIAAVKKIEGGSKNINTLKGVEFFTELTELECYYNHLTELDVSKNTKLTYLDCTYNQLTTLDLSANTMLNEVYIEDNMIAGDNMTAFANSLPTVTNGFLSVYELNSDDEHNNISTEQVEIMKGKGWKVNYLDDRGEYTLYSPVLTVKSRLYQEVDQIDRTLERYEYEVVLRYDDPEAEHHMAQLKEFGNRLSVIVSNLEDATTMEACEKIQATIADLEKSLNMVLHVVKLYLNGEATDINTERLSENGKKQNVGNDTPRRSYNLQGQRVGEGFKGIVVVNGKKTVKK